MNISIIFSTVSLVLLFWNASCFRLPLVKYRQCLHVSARLIPLNIDRNRNLRPSTLVVLNARSFSQNGADFELDLDDFDQILESIKVFKKVYGDCEIPIKFEVPEESHWPSTLHGFRLGRRLNSLQSSNEFMQKHPEKVQQLARIGWDPYSMKLVEEWSTLVDCLLIYKNIYGDLRIPAKFIVPDADPWPRAARNAKLGVRVAAIRSAGRYVKENPARKAELDAMGFEWRIRDVTGRKSAEEDKFQLVLQALQLYKAQHPDDALNVPNSYVIPNSPLWPEKLYGMKLGNEVQLIRTEGKYVKNHADRAQQLSGIGFCRGKSPRANDSGRRFETIYSALRVYRELYGDLLVPRSFVVPSQAPWPEAAWGVNLGVRVTSIRSQSTFVSNSMERRALLDGLGFCWEMRSEINRRARKKVEPTDLSIASLPDETITLTDEENMYDVDTPHFGESDSFGTQPPEELEPVVRSRDAKEKLEQEAEELAEFERELRRLFGDRMGPPSPASSGASSRSTVSTAVVSGQPGLQAFSDDALSSRSPERGRIGKDLLDEHSEEQVLEVNKAKGVVAKERHLQQRSGQEDEADEKMVIARRLIRSLHSPLDSAAEMPDRLRIPRRTYEEKEGRVAPFNPSRIFEPQAYREVIAAKTRREHREREASTDPDIREHAHFEGYLNSEQFNELMARPVDPQVVLAMKKEGYRIMDFGRFRFDDILQALKVYRAHHNDVNVPQDFIITEQLLGDMQAVSSSMSNHSVTPPLQDHAHGSAAYWGDLLSHSAEYAESATSSTTQSMQSQVIPIAQYDPRFAGMQLGEAVASLRIGDADGLEDADRRAALDALGFHWGDKRRHLRFRFIPLLLGLRIYRHLYGFPLVRPDFKVPDEKIWPYWMAGMPLGEWAAAARIQQETLREHYPQRVAMLDALEFLWWIPPPADMPARYYQDVV